MSEPITASWIIKLTCDCPKCEQWVNLLDYPDFWHNTDLKCGEHGTEASESVEVVCPECGHEFAVKLDY